MPSAVPAVSAAVVLSRRHDGLVVSVTGFDWVHSGG